VSDVTLTFTIHRGDDVSEVSLTQDVIKVGKLPSSHLRLEDDSVSRMHAVIEVGGPDDIYVVDLGSATGTLVDGERVNKGRVNDGSVLHFGEVRVGVQVTAAKPEVSPAGPAAAAAASAAEAPAQAAAPTMGAPAAGAPAVPPAVPGATPGTSPFQPKGLPTPFGGGAGETPAVASEPDPELVQYGIVASGPPVPAEDVETGDQSVEVIVMWGDRAVLNVDHLTPPRSYYVGDRLDKKGKPDGIDFLMASEVLGGDRVPVVLAGDGAAPMVVIPPGATGQVMVGDQRQSLDDLRGGGQLQPSSELPGGSQMPLPAEGTVRFSHNGFTFIVRATVAGKAVLARSKPDLQPFAYVGSSLAIFGAFLIMFYFLPPNPSSLSLNAIDTNSRLVKYLMEPPETQEEELPDWLQNNQDDDEGGKGKRHKDEEGKMGEKDKKKTKNKYAIEGPQDNEDPTMARERQKEEARNAGVLGALSQRMGAFNSPTSPFGADAAMGIDPMSALGAMMGDTIGENQGMGGLGLRGTGRGGGGTGEGTIGLGSLGTIGHGGGGGSGSGYGRGAGGLGGRAARVPRIRQGTADVRGSLSKEVIRRVIRRHLNEVRFCYEQQLNQRPDLEGRVVVNFIISPSGAVQASSVRNSSLGNASAESGIASAVRRWNFPAPDGGGIVVVNYPFVLQPTGG